MKSVNPPAKINSARIRKYQANVMQIRQLGTQQDTAVIFSDEEVIQYAVKAFVQSGAIEVTQFENYMKDKKFDSWFSVAN